MVIDRLKEASRHLERELGEEFIGLILFGSFARGEADKHSDVDVYVVLKTLRGMKVRARIYKILSKYLNRDITLIDSRLEDIRDDITVTPLLINIFADGIIIHDRDGILHRFISKGRELIEKAELIRYRTPDGKYGWRRRDGKPLRYTEV